MKSLPRLFILCIFCLLTACAPSNEEASDSEPTITLTPLRPQTKDAELSIEGMSEIMSVHLLTSPEGYPLDFSTYFPDDMQIDTFVSDEGQEIRITAAFGGQLNEEAYISVFAFKREITAEKAEGMTAQVARSAAGISVSSDDHRHSWTNSEYRLEGNRSGFLLLGNHNVTWFYILSSWPPGFGDGMGPRIQLILDEWQWEDGTSLES